MKSLFISRGKDVHIIKNSNLQKRAAYVNSLVYKEKNQAEENIKFMMSTINTFHSNTCPAELNDQIYDLHSLTSKYQ